MPPLAQQRDRAATGVLVGHVRATGPHALLPVHQQLALVPVHALAAVDVAVFGDARGEFDALAI